MKNLRERFKCLDKYAPGGYETWPSDYKDLIDCFDDGIECLLSVPEGDYQGDYYCLFLNKNNGMYGYLCFGYGSCSGCDVFQGCSNIKDYEELTLSLESSVIWKTKEDMISFLRHRDWKGQYHNPVRFILDALEILEG